MEIEEIPKSVSQEEGPRRRPERGLPVGFPSLLSVSHHLRNLSETQAHGLSFWSWALLTVPFQFQTQRLKHVSPHVIAAWDPATLSTADAEPESKDASTGSGQEKRGAQQEDRTVGVRPALLSWGCGMDPGMPWLLVTWIEQEAANWVRQG